MTDVLTVPDLDIVRTWDTPVRADDADGDGYLATMEVRFSRFNTWYEINSWWEGRFLERTARGAFRKTIRENGPAVKVLFNHGFDFNIGDKILGPIDTLREETDSPLGVVPLFDTSYNRDLEPGLRAGVYGSSFMFRVIKDEWDNEPGKSDDNPDGLPERTIKEVRLFEFGPVTWPANPDATAGLRCVSGTDAYYELLRNRDPQRVTDLRARVSATRTPATDPAAEPALAGAGAAPHRTTEPAARHSGGSAYAARERRLSLMTKGALR
jgi:HK97 family phage prohead protease